jgi:hypothetical protein
MAGRGPRRSLVSFEWLVEINRRRGTYAANDRRLNKFNFRSAASRPSPWNAEVESCSSSMELPSTRELELETLLRQRDKQVAELSVRSSQNAFRFFY